MSDTEYPEATDLLYRQLTRQLAVAIHRHREAFGTTDAHIAQQCDTTLWRTLDELTIPIAEGDALRQVPLSELTKYHWI